MELGGSQHLQVEKRSLHDQVASRIRDLIIEGYLEPGTRIDEAHLIEQLGVSRTPFRESLRTLAAEGLIVIRPARGSMVRALSQDEVRAMLEVLAQLEELAGRTACARASEAEIVEARALHDRMVAHHAAGERLLYYKLNQDFHSLVSRLSCNETLIEIQSNIQGRLKRIRFIGNGTPEKWNAAVADHAEMIAALEARDGPRMGAAMAVHLNRTWDRVRESI